MTKGQKGQKEFDEHTVEKPQNLAGRWPFDKRNGRVQGDQRFTEKDK